MNNVYIFFFLLLEIILHMPVKVEGYDFVIRSMASENEGTNFSSYSKIKNGDNGEWIGELFQDAIYNNELRRIGTQRGYGFNPIPNRTYVDNMEYISTNRVWFLEDNEELNLFNNIIVSATTKYANYIGGHVEENIVSYNQYNQSEFESEVTLIEPTLIDDDDDDDDNEIILGVTSAGGFYDSITDLTGEPIGEMFQNPIHDFTDNTTTNNNNITNDDDDVDDDQYSNLRIGTNQGFTFNFPPETFIPGLPNLNGNRKFIMDDGDVLNVFNLAIISGTGRYKKYTGTKLGEKVISTDPNFAAEYTLSTTTTTTTTTADNDDDDDNDRKQKRRNLMDDNDDSDAYYTFRITGGGTGFSELILDHDTKKEIGNRFQDSVFDPSGKRIGTNQGYRFDFLNPPSDNYNYTTGKPFYLANRFFYLEDGTLDVLNEVIVHGSGIYKKYTGGLLQENVTSTDPFTSDITLVMMQTTDDGDDNDDGEDESSSGGSMMMKNCNLAYKVVLTVAAVILTAGF
jgi:hypothetical protein